MNEIENNSEDIHDRVYNHIPDDGEVNQAEQEEEDPNEQEIMKIYELVDSIPLSRPKKNITRDFADGVLVAEIIKFFIPKVVELHNYISSNNLKTKRENWSTLNRKVLKKIGLKVTNEDIENIINYSPGFIEMILQKLFNTLYENGIDIQEIINEGGVYAEKNQNILISNNPEPVSKNAHNYNKGGTFNSKYNHIEEEYKQELIERDNIIDELKVALEETEKNLKISEENKKVLSYQLEVLKDKVRQLGLY